MRGLQKMVDENRYCPDILVQVSAVNEALRKVSESLLRSHLSHCVTHAIRSGDAESADRTYEELAALFSRYSR